MVGTNQRTLQQNKALHKYFELLAQELNTAGYDMRRTLKPGIDIPWTSDLVKQYLWKAYKKPHTTKFTNLMWKHYNTPRLGSLTDRKQKGEFGQEYVTVGEEAFWRRYNQENKE